VNPYRYAGYRWDKDTGLYFLQTRYYAPTHGRFISADTVIGLKSNIQTLNRYSYANNNPVILVDPEGMLATMVIGALIGGGSAVISYGYQIYTGQRTFSLGSAALIIGTGAVMGDIGGLTGSAVKGASTSVQYGIKAYNWVKSTIVNTAVKQYGKN